MINTITIRDSLAASRTGTASPMQEHIAQLVSKRNRLMIMAKDLKRYTTPELKNVDRVSRSYYEHHASRWIEEARLYNHAILLTARSM